MSKKIIYSRANRVINASYPSNNIKICENLALAPGLNSVDSEIIEILLKNKIFKMYIDNGLLIISDKMENLPLNTLGLKNNAKVDAKEKPKAPAAAKVQEPVLGEQQKA